MVSDQSGLVRRRILELAARWYVFIFLNVYGFGKILGGQFYRRGHLPPEVAQMTLGSAPIFELAWTFMGASFAYILFIGVAEIIGAWLLLWERTKLLGVAILLPIMLNIIVFDAIFFENAGGYGALASATIYTILLFVILALNQESVRPAVEALLRPAQRMKVSLKQTLVALGLMAALFAFDQLLVNLLGHGRG